MLDAEVELMQSLGLDLRSQERALSQWGLNEQPVVGSPNDRLGSQRIRHVQSRRELALVDARVLVRSIGRLGVLILFESIEPKAVVHRELGRCLPSVLNVAGEVVALSLHFQGGWRVAVRDQSRVELHQGIEGCLAGRNQLVTLVAGLVVINEPKLEVVAIDRVANRPLDLRVVSVSNDRRIELDGAVLRKVVQIHIWVVVRNVEAGVDDAKGEERTGVGTKIAPPTQDSHRVPVFLLNVLPRVLLRDNS